MNVYGLIGFPLDHSFSKKYFTEKFLKESVADSRFELFPIERIELLNSLVINVSGLKGLSVTIPYKETVIPFLDELDIVSKEIGAVNCIRIFENKLYGFNTDAYGFEHSFMPLRQPHHKKALVLGSGGASKAVKFVLKKHGIHFLEVSRNAIDSEESINYSQLDEDILREYTIIVNCTPLGMHPNIGSMPDIPYQLLSANHLLFDLVYNPAETLFLQNGKKAGAVTKNGYEMLQSQAEESWKIWNGII